MSHVIRKVAFENSQGQVLRVFAWEGGAVDLIQTAARRLKLCSNTAELTQQGVEFTKLASLTPDQIESGFQVGDFGAVRLIDNVQDTAVNINDVEESSKRWNMSLASVAFIILLFVTLLFNIDVETPELEEELKQHVVKVIKQKKLEPRQVDVSRVVSTIAKKEKPVPKKVTPKKKSIRRMGALAVLGQLNKGKTKGGLDLGAVKATAGPGLGGTGGSGGVQTSLYGKGLVAAPVGPGANINGGGGYGTKGKGGGKAGYGKVTLVGSSGASTIPLGRESIVEGGLDRDLIAAVINRNSGQIRFCYEKGLQTDPKLAGRVSVDFVINSSGRVSVAGVKNTTLHSKIVEDCILLRLKTWKFPLPEGGVDVKVSFPFMLRRLGAG